MKPSSKTVGLLPQRFPLDLLIWCFPGFWILVFGFSVSFT